MRAPMDEKTYLAFYKDTILSSSNGTQKSIRDLLVKEHKISFDNQRSTFDTDDTLYFASKYDFEKIISEATAKVSFAGIFEYWEFQKLYKYSLPLFYETPENETLEEILRASDSTEFSLESYTPEFIINVSLEECKPLYWINGEDIFIKFVLQKAYAHPETFDQIDYRYPIVIYINKKNKVLEIRYDATKYSNYSAVSSSEYYKSIITDCIEWLKKSLSLHLYVCDHANTIQTINDKQNPSVRIYRQMMQMSQGSSADLTASAAGGTDFVLPFIGELRELIEENKETFDKAEDVKQLLLQYLDDKEATSSYLYIYIKWVKPVDTQSYVVKITFDYFDGKYSLLQHITGNCKDLGMERMNDAIQYLCESSAFVAGEEI